MQLLQYMPPSQVLDFLQAETPPGAHSPFSKLTLEKVYAIRQKWVQTQRMHKNDKVAVDMLLKSPGFPVLYYVDGSSQNQSLKTEDCFQLALCSDFQAAMLKKFGDLVFLDGVHGKTKYRFLQLTMLVMDDNGRGCPVAFCMCPTEMCEIWVKFIKAVFLVSYYLECMITGPVS